LGNFINIGKKLSAPSLPPLIFFFHPHTGKDKERQDGML
jgi:hypothetical protein